MAQSPSPQRRKWVTAPEQLEPVPSEFSIQPWFGEKGIITGFLVQDPTGRELKRLRLVPLIHKAYPGVEIGELEGAKISYYDYYCVVELKR